MSSQPISSPFFVRLPLEIRNRIYRVLNSAMAYKLIDRHVIGTCRQAYEECEDFSWKDAILTLHFPRIDIAYPTFKTRLALRTVAIWFSFREDERVQLIGSGVKLMEMATSGNLREIRLNLQGTEPMADLRHFFDDPGVSDWLEHFVAPFRALKMSDLRICLDVALDFHRASIEDRRAWFSERSIERCEEILAQIHKLVGGPVSMLDVVCHQDGVQVRQRFADLEAELLVDIAEQEKSRYR